MSKPDAEEVRLDGLLSTAVNGAVSNTWVSKTSQEILADVSALLKETESEATAQAAYEGWKALGNSGQPGPLPGSFCDFDKLIIPKYQCTALQLALARRWMGLVQN